MVKDMIKFSKCIILQEANLEQTLKLYKDKLPEDVLTQIIQSDPTSRLPLFIGNYAKWLIKLYLKKAFPNEDLYKAKEYLTIFDKIKNRLPVEQRDLNKINSLQKLFDIVEPYGDYKSKKEELRDLKNTEAIKKFENKEWLIVIPLTYNASCYYGANTQWCTASQYTQNWFNKYSKEGPLYIIINKETNDKFQFHLESGSYMDQRDKEIDISDFLNDNRELEIFFEKEKEIRLQEALLDLRKTLDAGVIKKISSGLYIKKHESNKDLYYVFESVGPSCSEFMTEEPEWRKTDDVAISRDIMREMFGRNFNNFENDVLSLVGTWNETEKEYDFNDEEASENEKDAWIYMYHKLDFFSQTAIEKKYGEFFNERSISIITKALKDLNPQLKNIKNNNTESLIKLIYEVSPGLMVLIRNTIKETLKPTFFRRLREFLVANLGTLFEVDVDNMQYGLVIDLKNNDINVNYGKQYYESDNDNDYFGAEFKVIRKVNDVLESGDVDKYVYGDDHNYHDQYPIEFTFSLDDAISNTPTNSTTVEFVKNLSKNIREFVMDERQEKIKFERKMSFKKFIKENDFSVYDNKHGEKFWGNFGAGVLPYCSETKKFLLGYRSKHVNEPNTWNVFGGAIEDDEKNAAFAAAREFKEETGYSGYIKIRPLYVYQKEGNKFKYFNFLGIVPKEFTPNLNWETENSKWFTLDEILKLGDKHFGLISLLNNKYEVLRGLSEK